MAIPELSSALPFKDVVDEKENKENLTPSSKMKTALKFGSSGLSPFGTSGSKYKPFKILSDEEIAINSKAANSGKKVKSIKRRSLATLQQSSHGKGTLVGHGRESVSIKEAFLKQKEKKVVAAAAAIDSKNSATPNRTSVVEEGEEISLISQEETKDDLVVDAIALMKATEKVDDSYWKTIAEERRMALEETLTENEKLYDEIDKLQEDNEKLSKALSEAECFKILYNNLLAQNNEEES